MKKRFILLILLALSSIILFSCAEPNKANISNVPEQDVTFVQPDSNWKKIISTTTEQKPPGAAQPIKVFYAAWKKDNLSSIGISGNDSSGTDTKISRDALVYGIKSEILDLKKECSDADYSITNEESGDIRENVHYLQINYDFFCKYNDSKNEIKMKSVVYGIDSYGYSYSLQFKATEENFNDDIESFNEMLESITFRGN